jgi:hypothetical protein
MKVGNQMSDSKLKKSIKLTRRNIVIILILSITVFLSIILTLYNLQFVEQGSRDKIRIYGNVKREVNITLFEIKAEYQQVINQKFDFINDFGSVYDDYFTGAQVWDIFIQNDLLNANSRQIRFYGYDGYTHTEAINISIIKNNPSLVILAYEENGISLGTPPDDGPIKSVVNRSLYPTWNSRFSVRNLAAIVVY